ncbi:hypothetical protein J6590_052097 [Homalodisca vitripennis]|nr:hypothetical protein J6590_052097 [Homalodisca vitripennis]
MSSRRQANSSETSRLHEWGESVEGTSRQKKVARSRNAAAIVLLHNHLNRCILHSLAVVAMLQLATVPPRRCCLTVVHASIAQIGNRPPRRCWLTVVHASIGSITRAQLQHVACRRITMSEGGRCEKHEERVKLRVEAVTPEILPSTRYTYPLTTCPQEPRMW